MLSSYIKEISKTYTRGDAREETYYSSLEKLLNQYAESINRKNAHVTTLPKKTEAGNPDFRVWDGKQKVFGYIEAKSPDVANLDQIETSDQLKRYLSTFPNVILTNFLEFRLYRDGVLTDQVMIGRPAILKKLKTEPALEKEEEFYELLNRFFSFSFPKIRSAKSLATELAKRTKFLRDEVVNEELNAEGKQSNHFIKGFYEAFKQYLLAGLTPDEFADLYSQTITYGLFAARTRSGEDFNRKLAYDRIPRTIGILREVFRFISLSDVPKEMEWIIDDISEVLAVTDVKKILSDYFHDGKGKDPVIHFYETFLAEYDPKTREKRGVYYTPEPVVSYIVRSLHTVLKEKFGKADGFADTSVTVLDPAAGTLTFLAEAAKLAVDEYVSKYGEGGKNTFIKDHILKNFYAFELMMAPYAVGHLKMSFLLEELGYKLHDDDRFKLYLTNTLEMEELEQTDYPGMATLSEESHIAGKVKKEQGILVILGNPPYSGMSANASTKKVKVMKGDNYAIGYDIKKTNDNYELVANTRKASRNLNVIQKTWIGELIEHYKIVDGEWIKEKNLKWLQHDYVKFIRFAQWKIEQSGNGIVGFITNHSYFDNPTFRGMRQSLMKSFNEINVLDLHGNSLKKEKSPDRSKDENVFDIKQGVGISIFIKEKKDTNKHVVKHSDLWGLKDSKYNWLLNNNLKSTNQKIIKPSPEFYFFIPRDSNPSEKYDKFVKITDLFKLYNSGVITSRDKFVLDFDSKDLMRRIRQISDLNLDEQIVKETYKLKDVRERTVEQSRKELSEINDLNKYLRKFLYRPFDSRSIFYHKALIRWPVFDIMRHLLKENLAIIVPRQFKEVPGAYVTNLISGHKTVSAYDINYLFPLYLYPTENNALFKNNRESSKFANFDPNIYDKLIRELENDLNPRKIFYYVYSVLYSNFYRINYFESLKRDYPKIPFTKDYEVFGNMAELGEKLVNLHLMKSKELDNPIAKFQGDGDETVEKISYKDGRVYINKSRYFEGVEPEVYEYQIGGYQVCNKWLKDRKGRILSLDDIRHYCKVVTALKKTIEIQEQIDEIYPEVEKDLIEFK